MLTFGFSFGRLPRGLRARWVPAHRPAPDPPLLSEMDWLGNGEVDRLAGEALVQLRPDPELRAAAMQAEQRYSAAVAVGSAALEAQLAWAHTGVAAGPTRFPRKRVRFQARPRRRARGELGGQVVASFEASGLEPPPGVHQLELCRTETTTVLRCTRCSRSAPVASR